MLRLKKIGLTKGPVLLVCTASALRTSESSISVHFKVVFAYLEPKMCKFLFSFFKSNDWVAINLRQHNPSVVISHFKSSEQLSLSSILFSIHLTIIKILIFCLLYCEENTGRVLKKMRAVRKPVETRLIHAETYIFLPLKRRALNLHAHLTFSVLYDPVKLEEVSRSIWKMATTVSWNFNLENEWMELVQYIGSGPVFKIQQNNE